jgi:hypothetical protein
VSRGRGGLGCRPIGRASIFIPRRRLVLPGRRGRCPYFFTRIATNWPGDWALEKSSSCPAPPPGTADGSARPITPGKRNTREFYQILSII